jgi:hypothetical protein
VCLSFFPREWEGRKGRKKGREKTEGNHTTYTQTLITDKHLSPKEKTNKQEETKGKERERERERKRERKENTTLQSFYSPFPPSLTLSLLLRRSHVLTGVTYIQWAPMNEGKKN